MTVNNLHDKFVYHLQEMYYVENRLVDVLGELASDVANEELKKGFKEHREQTKEHVTRLEQVFEEVGEPIEEQPCPSFDALLEERTMFFENADEDQDMRDIHDLGAAAKNEHLEIAGYENLIMLARKLDLSNGIRSLLDQNLEEEQQTKKQLKAMADDSTARKMFARLVG